MLLSSLSILMGAILVPSDYLWVYSTHIVILCLYLIWSKRLLILFFTLLSLVCVVVSEWLPDSEVQFAVGDELLIDFDEKKIISSTLSGSGRYLLTTSQHISIQFSSSSGDRTVLDNFTLELNDSQNLFHERGRALTKATITNVLIADKQGSWWQRRLYINRQLAQISLRILDTSSMPEDDAVFSFRNRVVAKLDQALQVFSSWRFSKALLIGDDDLWSDRDTWMIRTLGLAHLFVVSGLHTGFMFAIGCILSRIIWQCCPNRVMLSSITRWYCDALVIIPLLFLYAYMTNWGEPVIRASIMLGLYLCARMMAIKVTAYGIITFALWLILLFNPRSILSPGLWLSFSMVYLLIGYCQTSTKLIRLIMLQVMLSTVSMVLILGWQDAISIVSIFINLLLIPCAAFIWFPWCLMACFEVLVIGSNYFYALLNWFLDYLMLFIEKVAFGMPLLEFESFSSSIPKWVMLFLVGYWVYQSPLKRGMISLLGIWCVLFSSMLFKPTGADFSIRNYDYKLTMMKGNEVLLVDSWIREDIERLRIGQYINQFQQSGYFISPSDISKLTARMLLNYDVEWVVLKQLPTLPVMARLNALQVNWLVLKKGEVLNFYFDHAAVSLRHSSCLYSFFLLKSDTCKRVEKLESVLNYSQI
ncbi:hypothetical protein C0J08_10650 [Marinomonas sp. CT5]|uniref:ComEC/Rec2 family competence protein n=1 Tax=Marinomonas sp. CT5 TaxID=2066133 RepID=UPI001BAFF3B1|nr:ComEC/Rec2 family competence protein [Marinomonas sp. CT5]QUX95848.1 hypothetical protein C0J08_10650 [Marinomonas sp. CT5]